MTGARYRNRLARTPVVAIVTASADDAGARQEVDQA